MKKNFLVRRKDSMTGKYTCRFTEELHFEKIKQLSKTVGVTINDIVMSSICVSVSKLFRENGDQASKIRLVIPANVRFALYPTRESVKLENRFTAIPLTLPILDKKIYEVYEPIKKVTAVLKRKAYLVYGTFFLFRISQALFPRELYRWMLDFASRDYTLAFSNIPGPIKPFYYKKDSGEKVEANYFIPFMTVAGRVGLGINCISFNKSFRVSVSADTGILSESQVAGLVASIE